MLIFELHALLNMSWTHTQNYQWDSMKNSNTGDDEYYVTFQALLGYSEQFINFTLLSLLTRMFSCRKIHLKSYKLLTPSTLLYYM